MTTEYVYEEGEYPLIEKDPIALLDYPFNWIDWLESDTIASHLITIEPGSGLTLTTSTAGSTSVTAWLSGGDVGKVGVVACKITTNGGRTDERSIRVKIAQR
jgi:hypothetical protein